MKMQSWLHIWMRSMENRILIDKEKLISGLTNEEFSDFEDCLHMECAKSFGANYIITRNVADYASSEIMALEPKDYIKL